MAVSAGGIRAGAAYVELFIKDNRLTRGLAAASAKLKAFGAGITSLGTQFLGLGTALATPLVLAVKSFADTGDQIAKMSARTGIAVESLSELAFAVSQSGSDLETFETAIRRMQQVLVDAAGGSKTAADTLARLGLTIADLKALGPEEQFKLLAEKLSRIENPALRAALAMDLFGKSGTRLLPLVAGGAKGIEELQEKARALGLTISTEDARAAEEFGDALDILWAVLKRGVFAVGAALVPSLMDLANWIITTSRNVAAWIDRNRGLVVSIAKIVAVVLGVGAALVALGVTVSLVGFAISGLITIFSMLGTVIGVIGSVLGALLSPIGLVVAALVGLGYLFATQTDAGKRMTDELSAGFMSFAETAKTAWGGIVAAIQAGDLELAAKIALAAINLEWAKAVLWWTEKWNAFKGIFVDGWHDVVAGLKLMFWDFTAWIARTFAFAIEKLFKAAAWVADKLGFETFARKLRENFDFSDENINRNRDRIKNQILDERARRQREANDARRADAAEAMNDVKKAADELRDAVKEAERKRDEAAPRVPPKAKSGSMSSLDEVIDLSKKVDVQGTFNALAVRGLGGESLNERTAKAVDQINDNVKKIAVAAVHGGLVFA